MRRYTLATAAITLITPIAFQLNAQSGTTPTPGAPGDTASLPALVVTATREPGAIKTLTATVTVLDGNALRSEGVAHLGEALRRVPGLASVRNSSFGSQQSLFMRGGQSNYVRVLVDGVPINDPGGVLDLGRITLDDVERIEVVRGPASVLYGSEAMTGVIQLFTRKGDGKAKIDAEIGGGSYGALRAGLGASGGTARTSWSLRGDHHYTDGILPFNNAYQNDGVVAALGFYPDAMTDMRFTARYNNSVYRYPTGSDGSISDRNAERTEHRVLLGFDAGRRWSDRIDTRVNLASNELHPRSSDGPDDAADTLGFYGYYSRGTVVRRIADLRTTVRWHDAQRFTVGAELARDTERSSSLSLSEFGDSPDSFRAARNNRALYVQGLGDVGPLSYTVGGRFDDNSAFGDFTTFRAGLAYRLTSSLSLRSSYGTAYKAPSFFENFAAGFTVGNADLMPELSRSAEIGVEARLNERANVRVTGFTQKFRDMIQYTGAPPSVGDPNYYNIAEANAGGVEAELALSDVAGFGVNLSHTWTDTRVVNSGFESGASANFVQGEKLIRRPDHVTALTLMRPLGDAVNGSLTVIRTGERSDRDFSTFPATPVELKAFTTVDLGLDIRLPARFLNAASLQVRAENLADTRYEHVVGFESPGRTLYAGLKLQR